MRHLTIAGATLALCAALSAPLAHADANDYVLTPTVEEGEKEIDFKFGNQRNRDHSSSSAASIGLGWGVNSWWFTEVYAKYKHEPGAGQFLDAYEFENRFQLTETGKYPVDVGFLLEIERPQDRSEGYEITYGPLLQTEWGKLQGNLNLLVQKHVRATAAFDTELHYQMQLKYRASEKLEWGAQALGSFGQWDHWSTSSLQEHKIGPAIFGKIKTGTKQAIQWNAALLHGTTSASPVNTLRIQAEYEF